MAIDSFADAVAFAKPLMRDSDGERSEGDFLLTLWSAAKLRWADVTVEKNETSIKLVNKDSDEARGKRMCLRGTIAQIRKEMDEPRLYSGLFFVGGMFDLPENRPAAPTAH